MSGSPERELDRSLGSALDGLCAEVLGRLRAPSDARDAPPDGAPDERLFDRLRRIGRGELDPRVSLAPPRFEDEEPADGELAAQRGGRARLEALARVAEGGMGEIWAVWDADLRRTLAMKRARGEGDARSLHRLLEEAQVTGQLEHPGIVPVHELGLDAEGRLYFTMQLVEGRDLGAILPLVRDGLEGWTLTRALGVLVRVCEALAFAHAKGVVHRDLKPANVMVGRFGEVYVMDWGLARVSGREDARELRMEPVRTDRGDRRAEDPATPLGTLDGSVVGTPAYMPPEQARGEIDSIDARSDVYSLGAILYHLLSGRRPYASRAGSDSAREVLRAVLAGPPEALASIARDAPAELVAVCEKAMERDPSARYASVESMASDLRAYLDGRVVAAHESGALAEFKKWVRRNRSVAALAGALAVALVAGTVVSSVLYVQARDRGGQLASALGPVDTVVLQTLVRDADAAWPLEPGELGAWRAWMERADALRDRMPMHRERLAGPGSSDPRLASLVGELERFFDRESGLVDGRSQEHGLGVARRVESVERALALLSGDEARGALARAVDAIRASPRYGGMELALPFGLWPLGEDPASGLFEFADLRTGAAPARDPSSGALAVGEGTAVVFVLVPAGRFRLGAQCEEPAGPNYVPPADLAPSFRARGGLTNESPVAELELREPFLLSKYELTQGQWLRATGRNPSALGSSDGADLRHPVEGVSWSECEAFARRFGWEIPTEVQWEYAARAGTSTPWSTGAQRESLRGAANLADRAYDRWRGEPSVAAADWPELDDGFGFHAPVGSFRPNAFGLHDVHGNVLEWCRDSYWGSYEGARWRPEDGQRILEERSLAVVRGGGFTSDAFRAHSSFRVGKERSDRSETLGFRPSLRVARTR